MFGGKKEKALQDELYTIKKGISEYSEELKEHCADDGIPRADGRKYRCPWGKD